ncbi:MAG: hypothetical protein AAF662_02805 [Pseudomonadota bacterium]
MKTGSTPKNPRLIRAAFLFILASLSGCATTGDGTNSGCDGAEPIGKRLFDPAGGEDGISMKTADLRELTCSWFSDEESDLHYRARRTSRRFANVSFVYAIASFAAYDRAQATQEQIPFPSEETWTDVIAGEANDKTSFFAKSWLRTLESGETELVVAYQGTGPLWEHWRDWTRGNAVLTNFFVMRTQFDDALDFAMKSIDIANTQGGFDRLVLTGHSLGGGLAQYTQRLIPDSRAVVFNASPNKGRVYSTFKWIRGKTYSVDVVRVSERGEILEYIRKPLDFDRHYDEYPSQKGKSTRWMDFYSGRLISGATAQHDMQDLAMNLTKVAASDGNGLALDVIGQLEACRTAEQLSEDYYKLVVPKNVHRKRLRAAHPVGACPH